MKGLPSGYNKDLQEDKQAVFDAEDTLAGLPRGRAVGRRRADAQSRARGGGGVGPCCWRPTWRTTWWAAACRSGARTKSSARWCGSSSRKERDFESLSLDEWRAASDLFDADIVGRVTPRASVAAKRTPQSTAPGGGRGALAEVQRWLAGAGGLSHWRRFATQKPALLR